MDYDIIKIGSVFVDIVFEGIGKEICPSFAGRIFNSHVFEIPWQT